MLCNLRQWHRSSITVKCLVIPFTASLRYMDNGRKSTLLRVHAMNIHLISAVYYLLLPFHNTEAEKS